MAPSGAWQIVAAQQNFLSGQMKVLFKYTAHFSGQLYQNAGNK